MNRPNSMVRKLQKSMNIPQLSKILWTGFSDAGYEERSIYDLPDMESELSRLWNQVSPLYKQLFTYVRRRLVEYYGTRRIRPDGPLPAHILGKNRNKFNIESTSIRYELFDIAAILYRKYVGSVMEKYHRFGIAL
mgnify:CR=1 FL=1